MKIQHITYARMPTEKAHGIQIHKMCEAFSQLGHDTTLVVPALNNPIKQNVSDYYTTKAGYTVEYLWMPDIIKLAAVIGFWAHRLNVVLFLVRLLFHKPSKDTLIITRTAEVAWLFKKKGYKVVYEVIDWPESWTKTFVYLLKKVDLFTCISEGLEEELTQRGFTNTIIARSAVDVADFETDISSLDAKKRLGLPVDKKIVMYIGSLDGWKGIETLFEASNQLCDSHQVVVIGGSAEKIKKYSTEYPNVLFLGQRPYAELPQNQKAADVLVVPNSPNSLESEKYTSPIKIFAHLLSGVPMLASELPSIKNIANEEQISFFEAGNSEDLAKKLQIITGDEAGAYTKKAEVAKEYGLQFSWESRASLIFEQVYSYDFNR